MRSLRVLVTRPHEAGERTASRLAALGHEPVRAPLTRILPLDAPWPPIAAEALLLTSANAVPALARVPGRPSLYAVGDRTAEAARAAGWPAVESAAGDAADLVALVRSRVPPGATLVHAAGRDRKPEPEAALASAGYRVIAWEVYGAEPASSLPPEAARALEEGVEAVLHYSRRGAVLYLALAEEAGLLARALAPEQLCLSADVADPLHAAGASRIRVAGAAREEDLLALLGR